MGFRGIGCIPENYETILLIIAKNFPIHAKPAPVPKLQPRLRSVEVAPAGSRFRRYEWQMPKLPKMPKINVSYLFKTIKFHNLSSF